MQVIVHDATEMEALAGRVAALAIPGLRFYLQGQLGAGKTTFVRGFLRKLGYKGVVKSPTYTLVEPYLLAENPPLQIYHFDLYRLNSPEELEDIGLRDYLEQSALCLLEWPEKAAEILDQPDLLVQIELSNQSANERRVQFVANTPAGKHIIHDLQRDG